MFPKKLRTKNFAGFTLVELIVVITILAILGTIGFVQMNGFVSSARDGRRVSDMSNITQAIELAIVTQGSAPAPSSTTTYTGGTVSIQVGKADSTSIAKMSGDFSDPLTKEAYNYSVFGNGNYYQLGIDFENPLSYTIGIPGIETVYAADTSLKYSRLSGNYLFDPSLPSLFPIASTINSSSGGIFSPDVCFVMEGSSTNTFGSSSGSCVAKKDVVLNGLDTSLVGYWDMESLTASGLLKDLSGNGNDGVFSGTVSTGWILSRARYFDGVSDVIDLGSGSILNPAEEITIEAIVNHSSSQPQTARTCKQIFGRGGMWDTTASYQFSWCAGWSQWWWVDGTWDIFVRYGTWTYDRYERGTKYLSSTNNTLTHLSIKKDKTWLRIYINGVESWVSMADWSASVNLNVWTPKKIQASSAKVSIWWALSDVSQRYFNGIIDDIKIYNRALSDDEIKQHAKIAGF